MHQDPDHENKMVKAVMKHNNIVELPGNSLSLAMLTEQLLK